VRAALAVLVAALAIGCGGESAHFSGSAYDTARDHCSLQSADNLSDEFGGDAADPASVARAYANEEFDGDDRGRARAGCVAGLESRG
jgi:hypothetical protein